MPELYLFGPAVQFIDSLDAPQRLEVASLLELIKVDPEIDDRHKFAFPVPPAIATLWSDSRYWVVYKVVDPTRTNIWNIGHAHESARPFRIVTND